MVNLDVKSQQAVDYMIEGIIKKLKMASADAIKPDHFNVDHYEDLRDIYALVENRSTFSISETEAIVRELGALRK